MHFLSKWTIWMVSQRTHLTLLMTRFSPNSCWLRTKNYFACDIAMRTFTPVKNDSDEALLYVVSVKNKLQLNHELGSFFAILSFCQISNFVYIYREILCLVAKPGTEPLNIRAIWYKLHMQWELDCFEERKSFMHIWDRWSRTKLRVTRFLSGRRIHFYTLNGFKGGSDISKAFHFTAISFHNLSISHQS